MTFLNEPEVIFGFTVKLYFCLLSILCQHTFKGIYIYDLSGNSLLIILFLNELKLICLHTSITIVSTVKGFQLLLYSTNNSI